MSSPNRYPYVFACEGCDTEITVTREEAADAYGDPDRPTAPWAVLERAYNWEKLSRNLYCPYCAIIRKIL